MRFEGHLVRRGRKNMGRERIDEYAVAKKRVVIMWNTMVVFQKDERKNS